VARLRGRLQRGGPPLVESSRASRCIPSLNASASQDSMNMREASRCLCPPGSLRSSLTFSPRTIDANDLSEGLVGFTEDHRHQPCCLPHYCLSFTTQARQPAVCRPLW
jgi:hypothetical protein